MPYQLRPISDRDKEILRLLSERDSTEQVAQELRLADATIRVRLYRLRVRYDKANEFLKEYRYWKMKLPPRKYL